ncbi:MAG: hypothetical protein ABIH18_04220 [Candidatus Omnitrophota bacterium]
MKNKIKNQKFLVLICGFAFFVLSFTLDCFAKDITILYTGETHAMLYMCSCPLHPEGGVTRRATVIDKLRKKNPDTLLLDAGGFFAGGTKDEYAQNSELDKKRSLVNLKAMGLMGYDAVNISDEEFNFGPEFLKDNIEKSGIAFVSCNLKCDKLQPYVIKNIRDLKIGIIGVDGVFSTRKAAGVKFIDPKEAINNTVQELKKQSVDIIILLSYLPKGAEQQLIKDVPGIDVFIAGYSSNDKEASVKIGSTLIVRPAWQGRSLGKLDLKIKNKKISGYNVKLIHLSNKIKENKGILKILPVCFSDATCKKTGFIGACNNPGEDNAGCSFIKPRQIGLLIITPKKCKACDTVPMINELKKYFPGIAVSYLYYPSKKAEKYIKDLDLEYLPVYLLSKDLEKEDRFNLFKQYLDLKGNFYKVKETFSGLGYYLKRPEAKGKIDVFISLYDKYMQEWLKLLKEYNPSVHFLAVDKNGEFSTAHGNAEVEENLRCACMQKYYPEHFWDYIICRAHNIQSTWWEDCSAGVDTAKIKYCAQSEEGKSLLKENISLNKEIDVMFGPAFLFDNNQAFVSQGLPTKEELRKIFKE